MNERPPKNRTPPPRLSILSQDMPTSGKAQRGGIVFVLQMLYGAVSYGAVSYGRCICALHGGKWCLRVRTRLSLAGPTIEGLHGRAPQRKYAPSETRVPQCVLRCFDSVAHEALPPLAPGVHACAENRYVLAHASPAASLVGFQFQVK